MFRQPDGAVGGYSSGPQAAGTVGTKSTGGFLRPEWSPCTVLVKFVTAVAYHTCLNLPETFTQPRTSLISMPSNSFAHGKIGYFRAL